MTLQERFNTLEKQCGTKEATNDQLNTKIIALESIIQEKEQNTQELEQKINEVSIKFKEVNSQLNHENVQSNDIMDKYTKTMNNNKEIQSKYDSLAIEYKQLSEEKSIIENANKSQLNDINQLHNEVKELKRTCADYDSLSHQFAEYKKRAQLALKQVFLL